MLNGHFLGEAKHKERVGGGCSFGGTEEFELVVSSLSEQLLVRLTKEKRAREMYSPIRRKTRKQ